MTVSDEAEPANPKEVVLHYSRHDDDCNAAFSMAENLKDIFRFHTSKNEDIWVYYAKTGIWKLNGKAWIAEIVTRSMSEHYKTRILNEVLTQIRNMTKDETIELGRMAPSRIVMANGVFDTDTCTFSPDFNPDDYQLVALPYEYDANADCPRFKLFLIEVCPNEEDRMALIEFMGYCLVHHHRIHTFIVLVGVGENGKSKFCGALCVMLGEENITGMTIQQLAHNTFMPIRLIGKLANIAPDIPPRPIKNTGIIKALTGEDLIAGEQKHKDGIDFKNVCKLCFSANEVPSVSDMTDAWFRRVRIIEFPNQFKIDNEKRDSKLGEKLAAEVQGIFNLSVEGLQRLNAQEGLTGVKSTEENRLDYLKRSSPLQYFAYRYCRPNPDAGITVEAAYDCYRRTAIKLGKVPITKSWFSIRLLEMLEYCESRQPKVGGKTTRTYAGLEVDLELLQKELGYTIDSISIYQGEVYEYSIMIVKNAMNAVPDSAQKILTPNGDVVKTHPSKQVTKPTSSPVSTTAVKAFHKWLSKLPNVGSRGFKESDVKKAHGESYSEAFSKYVDNEWLEQRGKNKSLWWKSKLGQSVLAGGGTK